MTPLTLCIAFHDKTGDDYMGLFDVELSSITGVQYDTLIRILEHGLYEPMKVNELHYEYNANKLMEIFETVTIDANLTSHSHEELVACYPEGEFDVSILIMEDGMRSFDLHDGLATHLYLYLQEKGFLQ